jgi:hypothetical protein
MGQKMDQSPRAGTAGKERPGFARRMLRAISPGAYFGQMAGAIHGLREFLWLGLALVYPVWVLVTLAVVALYGLLVALLWVIFLPLRLFLRVTHRGSYARAGREAARS